MQKTNIIPNFHQIITTEAFQSMVMPVFTIYFSPSDFAGKYVARLWNLESPTEYATVADTLEEIRATLPMIAMGLRPINRFEEDDPCIVEVWI